MTFQSIVAGELNNLLCGRLLCERGYFRLGGRWY
jgi:hypothetical protein